MKKYTPAGKIKCSSHFGDPRFPPVRPHLCVLVHLTFPNNPFSTHDPNTEDNSSLCCIACSQISKVRLIKQDITLLLTTAAERECIRVTGVYFINANKNAGSLVMGRVIEIFMPCHFTRSLSHRSKKSFATVCTFWYKKHRINHTHLSDHTLYVSVAVCVCVSPVPLQGLSTHPEVHHHLG